MYLSQGMYPTVILVLVAFQRSHLDSQFVYNNSTNSNLSSSGSLPSSNRMAQTYHDYGAKNHSGTRKNEVDVAIVERSLITEMAFSSSSHSIVEHLPSEEIA